MLLKAGVAMMALAVAFAAVVGLYALLDEPAGGAVAAEAAAAPSVEPLVRSDSSVEPWVEPSLPGPKPQPEPTAAEAEPEPAPEPEPPQPGPRPASRPDPPEPEPASEPEVEQASPRPEPPEPEPLVSAAAETEQPEPTGGEPAAVGGGGGSRGYELPAGAIMGLTVDALGLRDVPVFEGDGFAALKNGVGHVPKTSLPWSRSPQSNVYVAGHRLGYEGTESHRVFYRLGDLDEGDEIVLKDPDGKRYEYKVSEAFVVGPNDSWVMGQVRGRDMLTLQTCTPIPTFDKRLVVRADAV